MYQVCYKMRSIKQANIIIIIALLLLVEPVKFILYRFYKTLYMWQRNTMYELLFKRLFGLILGVLVFTPILNNIFKLINFNLLNLYLILVIFCFLNASIN